jgi:hypothetical protein
MGEISKAHNIVVGKCEGKRQLERPRHISNVNVKINLK